MLDPNPTPRRNVKPPEWEQHDADHEDQASRMVPFRASVTAVELDVERRPIREFSARTTAISCSQLEIHTRRMIYTGSPILIVLPLIDSTPCVVGCLVTSCSYDSAGDYLITLEFSNYARSPFVEGWMKEQGYSIFKPELDERADPNYPRDEDESSAESRAA